MAQHLSSRATASELHIRMLVRDFAVRRRVMQLPSHIS